MSISIRFSYIKFLSVIVIAFIFVVSMSFNFAYADEYIDSDDFLSDNDDNYDVEQNSPSDNRSDATNGRTLAIALSDNIRSLCELPENLKPRIYNAVQQQLVSSKKFKVITLSDSIQNELKDELERVVANEITDGDAAAIGEVSGVKYIVVLTVIDFSVQKENSGKSSKYKYGSLLFRIGVNYKLIDTTTHSIAASGDVRVIQRAALPKDRYNYVNNKTTVKETRTIDTSSNYDSWTRDGSDEYHTSKPGAFAEGNFSAKKKGNGNASQSIKWKNVYNLGYNDHDIKRNFKGKRVMVSNNSSVSDQKNVSHSGEVEEDVTYNEYYKLSQENFASNALAKAASKIGKDITESIVWEFYPIKIIKILKNGFLAINAGKDNGINKGEFYEAMSVSTEIDPDTGEKLEFYISEGIIKIERVSSTSSVGKIVTDDSGEIRIGTELAKVTGDSLNEYNIKNDKESKYDEDSFDSEW